MKIAQSKLIVAKGNYDSRIVLRIVRGEYVTHLSYENEKGETCYVYGRYFGKSLIDSSANFAKRCAEYGVIVDVEFMVDPEKIKLS